MPPLHAPMTARALAHMDRKATHDRRHRRQIFLILGRDARLAYDATAVGTGRRQRDIVRLVHDRRDGALATAPIRTARLPAGAPRSSFWGALRERRRLARTGATRGLQFVFQPRVLTLQPRPISFDARTFGFLSFEFVTQPRILSPQFVDRVAGRLLGAPTHASLMPEFPFQYKSDAVTICWLTRHAADGAWRSARRC